jgi:histone deacetylase 11
MTRERRFPKVSRRVVPIVYSSRYNITAFGLERLHPFDSRKYRRIYDWLIRQGLRRSEDFVKPRLVKRADLLRVHTDAYLNSLRQRSVLARILEVPIIGRLPAWFTNWRVLRPMRWATGGTIQSFRLALERGLAINLGGGFHHAGPDKGGGFCVYADVPLALAILHAEGRIRSALVVDTDAHQGDGTAEAIHTWPWAHILDFFEEDIFPWPKVEEDVAVPLTENTGGDNYMEKVGEHLPEALDAFRPDLVVYNAGSDVLTTDPLTRLSLSREDLAERDLFIVTEVRRRGIPLAMVLSGGYGPLSWEAHARSIEGILARFDPEIASRS